MGLTITANNAKQSFEMSYGGFFNLRKNIALSLDETFGNHYKNLLYCHTKDDHKDWEIKCNTILNDKKFDGKEKILDFLFAPDVQGQINYKTCGEIYETIKNTDFKHKRFQYATYASADDYENFKQFLKNCYSHRRNMVWY